MLYRGAFISVEGGDGSGKSTAMNYLCQLLYHFGYNVERTREPGGTDIAEKIRNIIVNENVGSVAETLLFAAARAEHVEKKIKPAMQDGRTVVSDRFYDSSFAYQGFGRGHLMEVEFLRKFSIGDFKPDHTLFLTVAPETMKARLRARAAEQNRLDHENDEFRQKCLKGFNLAAELDPERMVIIDANGSIDDVQKQIYDWVVKSFVPNHHRPYSYFNETNDQIAAVLGMSDNATQIQKDMARLYVTEKVMVPGHSRGILEKVHSEWKDKPTR